MRTISPISSLFADLLQRLAYALPKALLPSEIRPIMFDFAFVSGAFATHIEGRDIAEETEIKLRGIAEKYAGNLPWEQEVQP